MRSSKFIKAITLSCFFILMAGFVVYKSDVFTEKEKAIVKHIDSPVVKHKTPTMLPTSKSAILLDNNSKIQPDDTLEKELARRKKRKEEDSMILSKVMLMAGSKSAVIFNPEKKMDTPKVKPAFIDTSPKIFLQEKSTMGSSKSMIMTQPWTPSFTPLVPEKKKKNK